MDFQARELRKGGLKLKIQEQPFQVLAALLERPGEIVEREDLRLKLWPKDTFVDFDHSLNTAINKLRETLGDSADSPRFIETVPRRGYRFIAPVERIREQEARIPETTSASAGPKRHRPFVWAAALFAVFTGAVAVLWLVFGTKFGTPEAQVQILPFTSDPGQEWGPAFSPDGKQIAYSRNGDIFVRLVGAGEPLQLTSGPERDASPTWSPDGNHIAFCRGSPWEEIHRTVFSVPVLGGPERRLGEIATWSYDVGSPRLLSWSPGGEFLAYRGSIAGQSQDGIFLLSVDTGEKRQLASLAAGSWQHDTGPVFSPDGRMLALAMAGDIHLLPVLEQGGTKAEPKRLTFDRKPIRGLDWTADGKSIVFSSSRGGSWSLWRVPVSGGEPERLSVGGDASIHPSVCRQGDRMAYVQAQEPRNIWRAPGPGSTNPASESEDGKLTTLIASSRIDGSPHFSPDGMRIAFVSTRSGRRQIWTCDQNGENLAQVTSLNEGAAWAPRWSPDGRRRVFVFGKGGVTDIYLVRAEGGSSRPLVTDEFDDFAPSWSHDGKWIYFESDRSRASQVWKVPVEGGQAIQVTKTGGTESFESADGKYLYYVKDLDGSAIWRIPTEGGEETQVFDRGSDKWGRWALLDDGVCFFTNKPAPAIEFYEFATGQTRRIIDLPEETRTAPGFTVSPDRRYVLFVRLEHWESDIMLVENFR